MVFVREAELGLDAARILEPDGVLAPAAVGVVVIGGLRGRVVLNGNVVAQSALDRLHRRERFRPRLAGYEGQGPVVAVERDAHEDLSGATAVTA